LLLQLRDRRSRDRIILSTTIGPHRDDWTVMINSRPIFSAASRGQQRVAVLALLLLQAAYLELRRGEKPVILLDDIFSELDAAHRENVLGTLSGNQVILTTTEMPEGFSGTV